MRVFILTLALASVAQAQMSASIFTGSNALGGSLAYQLDNRQAEVGCHFLSDEVDSDDHFSIGVYGALRSETVMANLIAPETAIPFAGGNLARDFDAEEFWASGMAGFVFLPNRAVSPIAFAEYAWYPWADKSNSETRGFFGLRVALQ